MADIRFDNRVAIVTGAGVGLGRAHALGLAARGPRLWSMIWASRGMAREHPLMRH